MAGWQQQDLMPLQEEYDSDGAAGGGDNQPRPRRKSHQRPQVRSLGVAAAAASVVLAAISTVVIVVVPVVVVDVVVVVVGVFGLLCEDGEGKEVLVVVVILGRCYEVSG